MLIDTFLYCIFYFFFLNDTATTEIYTLSLHDALPIRGFTHRGIEIRLYLDPCRAAPDRKSTRLNSSHEWISYAVCCLKNKKRSIRCWCRGRLTREATSRRLVVSRR